MTHLITPANVPHILSFGSGLRVNAAAVPTLLKFAEMKLEEMEAGLAATRRDPFPDASVAGFERPAPPGLQELRDAIRLAREVA